jgi:type VI secretion system protein ImpJ
MAHKPIWTEGLLVSQHHFQQQDTYFEDLLNDRLRGVTHYDWGLTELGLDERGLAAGQFRLLKFSAIWPDGTSIACGEGAEVPAPAPRELPADQINVDVYLGLAAASDAPQLTLDGAGARRFAREIRSVADTNSGASPQELEWSRPNLQILFGHERREGFVCIRVASVERRAGQFVLLDTRIPPTLFLHAAPFLEAGVRRVLVDVLARQQGLARERRQRQTGKVEFHATEVRKFWLLHTLNGTIPLLNHLLDTPRVHPEEAYVALVQLAGMLSSFTPDVEPNDLPKFNYLELGDTFEPLFATLLKLLQGGLEASYTEIPLEYRSDGMYTGRLAEPRLFNCEFFVGIKANQAEALVRERIPEVLKIADWKDIYDVVKQQRKGVRMGAEWSPSGALPLKPGVCFFRVAKEGQYWESIARTSTVALYLPAVGEWAGTELALYAVEPAKL